MDRRGADQPWPESPRPCRKIRLERVVELRAGRIKGAKEVMAEGGGPGVGVGREEGRGKVSSTSSFACVGRGRRLGSDTSNIPPRTSQIESAVHE